MRVSPLGLLIAALLVALAGCGGGNDRPDLTVSAASSLTNAFTQYGSEFPEANVRFLVRRLR